MPLQLSALKDSLIGLGQWVYQNDEALTAIYGFDGICDVLEVNPVHRAEVIQYAQDERRAILAVAFDSGLEDSARGQSGRHPEDWKTGSLYHALREVMMQSAPRSAQLRKG